MFNGRLTRREFLKGTAGLGAAMAVNEVVGRMSSVNPALKVVSGLAYYDAPQSPIYWTDWLKNRVKGSPKLMQVADQIGESLLRNRPQSVAEFYRRVDETNLLDFKYPHNAACLAIAYLGWFGPHDVQRVFPAHIPGLRKGPQSDGGIHLTGNAALANELSREANDRLLGRLNFGNFVGGVGLMERIIGSRNINLVDNKFLSGEYGGVKVRLGIEGLVSPNSEVARAVVSMGRDFEALTTQFLGDEIMTESQLLERNSQDWYLDRTGNSGRKIDAFFDRVSQTKPSMELNSGALDEEVLDDLVSNQIGAGVGIMVEGFDRQGVRGSKGTAFGRIEIPFDNWNQKVGRHPRYPLPDQIDAIVVRGNRIGWRDGARVYCS